VQRARGEHVAGAAFGALARSLASGALARVARVASRSAGAGQ